MLPFKNLLFDLDGTLIDSSDGIIRSAQYAFEKLGKEVPPYKTMFKFVGPPLDDTFRNDYGFTPEESIQAVLFYRERYHIDGVKEAAPYEGIDELLTDLRQAGYDLYVATSKPEKLAQEFLAMHGLAHHFTEICRQSLEQCLGCNRIITFSILSHHQKYVLCLESKILHLQRSVFKS